MLRDADISVILVDQDDNIVGYADKLEAHRRGLLHRAFSVLLYNDQGELLIQKRAATKYHAGGLWANTCCGHPYAGEKKDEAAIRRTKEELGIVIDVEPLTHIYYKKAVDDGMVEHEYVHVFQAHYQDQIIRPDPSEVSAIKWMKPADLRKDIAANPEAYAAWFRHYMEEFYDVLFGHLENDNT
jgi:isopentenyl-diphosphate delta-isomerase, type 1